MAGAWGVDVYVLQACSIAEEVEGCEVLAGCHSDSILMSSSRAEMVRLQNDFGKNGTARMLRNWVNRHYIEKIPPKGANAGGADGKQGEKVLSIQLFSFKKLLFRSDGLDLRGFDV